jgi:hypothetical protein
MGMTTFSCGKDAAIVTCSEYYFHSTHSPLHSFRNSNVQKAIPLETKANRKYCISLLRLWVECWQAGGMQVRTGACDDWEAQQHCDVFISHSFACPMNPSLPHTLTILGPALPYPRLRSYLQCLLRTNC